MLFRIVSSIAKLPTPKLIMMHTILDKRPNWSFTRSCFILAVAKNSYIPDEKRLGSDSEFNCRKNRRLKMHFCGH